jgi:hypothetical protein
MSLKYKGLRMLASARGAVNNSLTRKTAAKVGFLAGGAIAGAAVGSQMAQPGLKKEGARSGAITGAVVGSLPIVGKPIAKVIGRGIAHTPGIKEAGKKANMIFRRIRGRIVPIRAK